jgi:hypothetical protein
VRCETVKEFEEELARRREDAKTRRREDANKSTKGLLFLLLLSSSLGVFASWREILFLSSGVAGYLHRLCAYPPHVVIVSVVVEPFLS